MLGVFAAIVIALLNIRNTRAIARLKATLDLIEKAESSEHYRTRHESFAAVRRANAFAELDDPADEDARKRRFEIAEHLNHYELVAIGIRRKVLDDDMYRTWMAGPFVRDWNAAAGWIQRERWKLEADGTWIYRDATYANYQAIARAWSPVDAINLTRDTSPPPDIPLSRPLGPGDEPLPDTSGTPE